MKRVAAFAVVLCAPSFVPAQRVSRGVETWVERRRLERILQVERERIQAEQSIQRERLELERQRLEMEKARQAGNTQSAAAGDAELEKQVSDEIRKALLSLGNKYADLRAYLPEMQRLVGIFAPGSSPEITVESYLEGLYVIAKHATFSRAAQARRALESGSVSLDPGAAKPKQ